MAFVARRVVERSSKLHFESAPFENSLFGVGIECAGNLSATGVTAIDSSGTR